MSILKKGKKQSMKTKKSIGNKPSYDTVKTITFPQLHKYSVENSEKFNRNVFTEELIKDYPHIKNLKLVVQKMMFHQQGLENGTPLHIRTSIFCGDDIPTFYQDFTLEQWDSLDSIPQHIYNL